jgi:general stress protein 26
MEEKESLKLCKELLETGWPAYLTTIDGKGYPQTRAMFNLRNQKWFPKLITFFEKRDDFTIIFSTNTSSTKIKDIKTNSAASVYYCNPESWKGVMFGGNIEIVDDLAIKKDLWHDDWDKYYPNGYDDPDHSVLRLSPTIAKGWAGSMTFKLELGDSK